MKLLVIFFTLAMFSSVAVANPFGYTVNRTNDTLYRLNLSTGDAEAVGSGVGLGDVEALSFDPRTEVLYGLDDTTDSLIRIDTTSGIATQIGAFEKNVDEGGLAISDTGQAVFSDEDGDTYFINLETAAIDFIGDSNVDTDNLAFRVTTLFGIDRITDDLYRISLADATPTLVGNLGVDAPFQHGLSYHRASDLLYYGDDNGDIYTVDPETGAASLSATAPFALASLAIFSPPPPTPVSGLPLLGVVLVAFLLSVLGAFRLQQK